MCTTIQHSQCPVHIQPPVHSQYDAHMHPLHRQYAPIAPRTQSVRSQCAVIQSVCSQYAVNAQSVCSQYAPITHYSQHTSLYLCLHMTAHGGAHMPLKKPRSHSALSHLSTHSPLSARVASFGLRVRPEAFQLGAQCVALKVRMTLHHTHCSAHCSINNT